MPDDRPDALPLLDRAAVGRRLRQVRKARQLTLKQLSEASGVPVSTLSKMELAQVSVSYEKLAAAARALNVDIAQLFRASGTADTPVPVTVVVDSLAAVAGYATGTYDYHPIAGAFPERRMTPAYARIIARERGQFDDFIRHPGQEFALVLSGRVRIEFETGEAVSIGPQETAYFNSQVGHIYLSESEDGADAQVMVVMTDR
ncbi:XRE family transcriptional regulator [Pseudomonas kermanshahensis]|uniref:XRE family transcriptional regulator n=1 Tax=Pseudomonas kermanshahensis TaxID=2745482 RepID=A0ABU8R202_9PSED|nr:MULTISPECIES: XRE family transcriptional regulator [Pseudomonas]MBC3489054.1 helix-turn-helix transcriptional regulator [Pseudomonas sp. SWRI50]MBC3499608.1 helix-turn-helix transcriptional regulator [Pseudomonas sp. SWRI67]MBV4527830.1 XRE family transcriptional regulator [Pseudomonas kermanshahensis]SMF29400.1 transcriptional regulator, XRE family with cupin sensor [Pseudomonas sp. LAIL14HWK12:I11]SMR78285.1 transcriptional regulator, XRE family with cupin sensor [Pseudomonas sp. LAIL14HW